MLCKSEQKVEKKEKIDEFSPLFDFTSQYNTYNGKQENLMDNLNKSLYKPTNNKQFNDFPNINARPNKIHKRSVSETKKKYVASQQEWKCGHCDQQLNAWFEVDHKIRLEHGGGNDVQNLVALCRECHGKKTAMENM